MTHELTGQQFGRLTVLHREPMNWTRRAFYRCLCACGTECVKMAKYLRNGDTSSCGCAQREMRARGNVKHGAGVGGVKTREYRIWRSMKSRCYTPTSSNYRFYGARGVRVCDAWRDDFSSFLADMGPCPEGHTIDRIDPERHYEPSNCRWATWSTQHNNTRRTVYVTIDGQMVALADAARSHGVGYHPLYDRVIRRHISLKDAVEEIHAETALSRSETPGAR